MKKLIIYFVCFICLTSFQHPKSTECEIEAFYKGVIPKEGTKILTSSDDLKDVKFILEPVGIEDGKYILNITRKSANLYKVDDKNIYILTKYCYEYSYSQEVVLIVEGGYAKGKILF